MNKVSPDIVSTDVCQFLKDLANGQTIHDMAAGLERVVKAVTETKKAGKLILTIDIGPLKGSVQQLAVESFVRETCPRHTETSVFFATKQNTLTRKNPNQMDFSDKTSGFQA